MVVEREGYPPEDAGVESLLSVVVLKSLLPVDGSKVEDAAGGPAWQEAEQVAEVGPGLDVVELAAGEEGDKAALISPPSSLPLGGHPKSGQSWTPAVSSSERNNPPEDFRWFHPGEALSRTRVEFVGDGRQLGLSEGVEVGAFRKILPKQAVRIFVTAALPRAVRIAEEDLHVRVDSESGVFGHLFALVPGEASPQFLGELLHLLCQRLAHVLGTSSEGQGQQHDESTSPLHQSSDGRLAVLPDDEVALPMPRDGAISRFRRSVGNHRHVAHAAPLNVAPMRLPPDSPCAQIRGEFIPQRPARLDEERLVDGLVRDAHAHVQGVVANEPCCNLLGDQRSSNRRSTSCRSGMFDSSFLARGRWFRSAAVCSARKARYSPLSVGFHLTRDS